MRDPRCRRTNVANDREKRCLDLIPPCLVRLQTEGALIQLPRGFGRRGDALEALIPRRTMVRVAGKGLVTIQANSANGIITARITKRGRYILEQMTGAGSRRPHLLVSGKRMMLTTTGAPPTMANPTVLR